MRTLCVAIAASLLLAGCGTGAYVVGPEGELAWSVDDAASRLYRGDLHEYLAGLSDLYKQANKRDREVIVQRYWYGLLGVFENEGSFRPDEIESLRAMADPDFAQRLDTEIAALKEEQVRKQERAKAEEAKKAQQEKEKVEADLRQLKQDTAAFLQQHSGKSIRNMTTLEVQELVGLWTDLQSRWDKFEANNKDEFKQSRLNVLSLETFYSVFGKPGRVQTGLAATAWGGFFDCNVFVYECRDSIVGIKVTVEKKDGSTLTRIVGFEAS